MFRRGRLPDFLILGAQKAGTTSLAAWLESHPECWMATEKEVHYFDLGYGKGARWYRSRFAKAPRGACRGEATPYYLFHPDCPARIAADLPEAKLVVILRDPVERAISGYFHAVRFGREPLAIDEAMEAEADRLASDRERGIATPGAPLEHLQWHSYQARGEYAVQIERYRATGCGSRMMVTFFEELLESPDRVLGRICEHLGVSVVNHPLDRRNRGIGSRDGLDDLRRRLRSRFEEADDRLESLLGRSLPWRT